jgi:glycosyltransferase involved in cell wall biosynthesis
MRLALLAHAPVLGGSTDLLVQAWNWFEQRGHSVQAIFGDDAPARDPRVQKAVVLQPRREDWRGRMREYLDCVETFKPDVVYAISGRDEMDLFRFLRCPRVRHTSSLEQHLHFDVPHILRMSRDFMEACTANTPDAIEQVERLTGQPTFLLPYLFPEPPERNEAIPFDRILSGHLPVEVAFVSRLERVQKRAHWLPEIIRRTREAGANVSWHIYGDGPEGAALRGQLENLSNVTFHGWVSRALLYEKLPRHDLLFFCSLWEGLPISMVEGMRCGLACLAPDIPAGIRWTLQQGGGWLYRADSPRACSEALLSAVKDPKLIVQKRLEAYALASRIFKPSLAEEGYLNLERQFQNLKFNGRYLSIDQASRFRAIPLRTFLKRAVLKRFKASPF